MNETKSFKLLRPQTGEASQTGASKVVLPLVEDIARRAQRLTMVGQTALSELKNFWRQFTTRSPRKSKRQNQRSGYRFQRALAAGALAVSMISGSLAAPQPARAATFSVNSIADSGPGSLREAIIAANENPGPDVVAFDASLVGQNITISSLIVITDDVEINGPGSDQLTLALSNYGNIQVNDGNPAALSSVQISGLSINGAAAKSGAIENYEDITLTDISVTGICGPNGSIYTAGGILTIVDSVISGNDCGNDDLSFLSPYSGGIVIYNAQASIQNSIISDNSGTLGGGIHSRYSDLTVSNTYFAYNAAALGGGILSIYDESLTLTDVTIIDNDAVYGGGLFAYAPYGNSSIVNTIISGNSAKSFGGGVILSFPYNTSSTLAQTNSPERNIRNADNKESKPLEHLRQSLSQQLAIEEDRAQSAQLLAAAPNFEITGSLITGNAAGKPAEVLYDGSMQHGLTGRGGGLFLYEGNITIQDTQITYNSATGDGGGLYASDGVLEITNSMISENISGSPDVYDASYDYYGYPGNYGYFGGGVYGSGGGIYLYDTEATISGSVISNNSSNNAGGGLFLYYGSLALDDSVISGNNTGTEGYWYDQAYYSGVEASGGGLYGYGTNLSVTNSRFENNSSNLGGGGLYLDSSQFSLVDSTIAGNTATNWGGGMYIDSPYSMYIDGAYVKSTIRGTTISGNTSEYGGGLYITDSYNTLLIENATISANDADYGGGLYLYSNENVLITHSTLVNNTASESGAGILASTGRGTDYQALTLENSIVANNLTQGVGDDLNIYNESAKIGLSHSLVQAPVVQDPTNPMLFDNGGNLFEQDPKLGPLADNGGTTLTHKPQWDSPVVNAGDPAFDATLLTTDQRGSARVASGRLDMGAVELNPGSLAFAAANTSVEEGSKTITITVTRSGGSETPVSVQYASSGSASDGSDYTATAGQLQWAAGETGNKTFTLTLLDDMRQEGDETIVLTLTSVTGGAQVTTSTYTVTILDNDFNVFVPLMTRP